MIKNDEASQHQGEDARRNGDQSPLPNMPSPQGRVIGRSELIQSGSEQRATTRRRRQQRTEAAPVEVHELAYRPFKLLRANAALPAAGQMLPEPVCAAR